MLQTGPSQVHVLSTRECFIRKQCSAAQKLRKFSTGFLRPKKVDKSYALKFQWSGMNNRIFDKYRFRVVTSVLQCYVCVLPVCLKLQCYVNSDSIAKNISRKFLYSNY